MKEKTKRSAGMKTMKNSENHFVIQGVLSAQKGEKKALLW